MPSPVVLGSSSQHGATVQVCDPHARTLPLPPAALQRARQELEERLLPSTCLSPSGQPYTFLDRQPYATLSSGHSMPLIGLGTWKSDKGKVKAAVEAAIRAGYRHIDCAYVYENEHEVGEALATIAREGVVQREDLFITGKLWNSFHSPEAVLSACKRTLRDLGTSYLDLFMIHWPVSGNRGPLLHPPYSSTWSALESLVDSGLVRSIGVSNLSALKLQTLLSTCRIRPAVNQVEVHPFFRNDALLRYCRDQGVHVTAYAPLGSPDSASVVHRQHTPSLLQHPQVLALAQKYHKNAGQVLVRWALQHGTSVLPKSANPQRIASNIQVLDWELEAADFEALSNFELQVRLVDGSFWLSPQGPYCKLSDLWDEPDPAAPQPQPQRPLYTGLGGVIGGVPMPEVMLNSGHSMPLVGLGTWKSEKGQVKAAVEAAIRMGYRHIDCAAVYQNEHEVGEALQSILQEGVVRREELFITSKLWNTDHEPARVAAACRKTMLDLQLSYLDLYLIHWPATGIPGPLLHPPYSSTWSALESLVDSGLVRSIGVSNLSALKLQTLLSTCRIRPAVNQVEVHPFFRNDALLRYCRDQGVHVTAYAPLGSPDSASIMGRPRTEPSLMQEPTVLEVAARTGKSPAQVLVRWALQRGTSVLPKSVKPERLSSNIAVLDWELSAADVAALSSMKIQRRMVGGSFLLHPSGPYRVLKDLWDEDLA